MAEQMNFITAVNAALDRALTEWPETLVFGEDVAKPGGVFGATKGLQRRHGERRVFDTPISEAAILGTALGAALRGKRPIAEIMWADFSLVAFDQLANQAANVRYVSNGTQHAPMTVRTQQGHLPGSCAQHSQCLEALFAHIPGIRVAMPSTPNDAYQMTLSAIACDDPTVVIEHRALYFGPAERVEVDGPIEPVGGAAIRRPGSAVTLISWGAMVPAAIEAADAVASDVDVEVVDLRWIDPLDVETIVRSVQKTSKVVVAHEANVTGGFGAEVAARISADAFDYLDAPVARVGLPDVRVPAAPHLQAALFPSADSIAHALREMAVR